jgi:hypothetical protein
MQRPPIDLEAVARLLVGPGRGILAADESSGTIDRRFRAEGIESTEATRRAYRNLLDAAVAQAVLARRAEETAAARRGRHHPRATSVSGG